MATVGVKRWLVPGAKFVVVVAMVWATLFTLDGGAGLSVAGLALLATCVIALGNWALARDLLHPPFVLGLVWGGTLLFYSWVDAGLPRLHAETGALIVLGYFAFSLGGVFHSSLGSGDEEALGSGQDFRRGRSGRWLVLIALLGLPFYVRSAYQLALGGLSEGFMVNLRRALTEDEGAETLGLPAYGASVAVFGSLLCAAGVATASRLERAVLFAVALVYAFFSSGRTMFLMLFVSMASALAIRGRVKLTTAATVGGVTFGIVFTFLGYLTGKIGDQEAVGASGLLEAFQGYLLGGLAALDDVLRHAQPLAWGRNTLRTIHAVLFRLGLGGPPISLVQEFRDVGVITNVYTVHRPYLDDFSWPGALLAQLAFGWAHTSAHYAARRGLRAWTYVYAIMMYPLVMQFFQDQYFNLLSTWAQAFALMAMVGWWEGRARRRGEGPGAGHPPVRGASTRTA